MKKIFFLLFLCLIGVAVFVNYTFRRVFDNDHNLTVKISEDDNTYKLRASFSRGQTHRIQRYMDEQLHSNHVFTNARLDADVTLDDKTTFYIKLSPGKLYIKMDKDQNDSAACYRMKELGEGIKAKLTGND